jgi:hypothetical protein
VKMPKMPLHQHLPPLHLTFQKGLNNAPTA